MAGLFGFLRRARIDSKDDSLLERGFAIVDALSTSDASEQPVARKQPRSITALCEGERCSRSCSRLFHLVSALAFLSAATLAIGSLARFSSTQADVQRSYLGQGCILYTDYHSSESYDNMLQLGDGSSCRFAVFGEVAVAVIAALLFVAAVVKVYIAAKKVSLVSIAEGSVLLMALMLAASVSVDSSIGLAHTCSSFAERYPGNRGSCSDHSITLKSGSFLYFYEGILSAVVLGWSVVSVLLAALLVLYVVPALVLCCYSCAQHRRHQSETGSLLTLHGSSILD